MKDDLADVNCNLVNGKFYNNPPSTNKGQVYMAKAISLRTLKPLVESYAITIIVNVIFETAYTARLFFMLIIYPLPFLLKYCLLCSLMDICMVVICTCFRVCSA